MNITRVLPHALGKEMRPRDRRDIDLQDHNVFPGKIIKVLIYTHSADNNQFRKAGGREMTGGAAPRHADCLTSVWWF